MKQKIQGVFVALALVLGMSTMTMVPVGAVADFPACAGNQKTTVCKAANDDSIAKLSKTIISLMLFALGTIAVIMIIVGGIRYTTSNGDSAKVKAAKDTVLYSVVGLVVAMLAYAIVNFVVGQF